MNTEHWGWIAAYVVTPVLLAAVTRTYARLKRGPDNSPLEDETPLFRFGAGLVAVAFWPLVLTLLIGDTLFGYVRRRFFDSPMGVYCQRKHLLRSSTVKQAEAGATMVDPLGRVPSEPFGHLNRGWQDFLAKKRSGDRLKSFLIPGDAIEAEPESGPNWSMRRGRKLGYAWVGLWKIKAEFIYEWD